MSLLTILNRYNYFVKAMSSLVSIEGEREQGADVREQNGRTD